MLEITNTTCFVQSGEALTASFDDGLMMMDPIAGRYYQLNTSSLAIWELIAKPVTLEQLVNALSQRFEGADNIEAEVRLALEQLHTRGLVVAE